MPIFVILSVVLAFVAGSVAGPYVAGAVLSLAPGGLSATLISLIVGVAIYLLTIGIIYVCARYVFHASFGQLGLEKPTKWRYFVLVPAIFVGYFAVSVLLSSVLSALIPSLQQGPTQDLGFKPGSTADLWYGGLLLIAVAPLAEEFIFRGYLFGLLRGKASFIGSALATSLLFGAAHVYNNQQLLWLLALDTFLLSLVLCWLRERTGNIWAGVGLHALKNSLSFVLLFIVKLST